MDPVIQKIAARVTAGEITSAEAMAAVKSKNPARIAAAAEGQTLGDVVLASAPENQPAGVFIDDILASNRPGKQIAKRQFDAMCSTEQKQLLEEGYEVA